MRDTPIEKDRVTNERVTLSFLYGSFLIEESLPTPLRGASNVCKIGKNCIVFAPL